MKELSTNLWSLLAVLLLAQLLERVLLGALVLDGRTSPLHPIVHRIAADGVLLFELREQFGERFALAIAARTVVVVAARLLLAALLLRLLLFLPLLNIEILFIYVIYLLF